MNIPQPHDSEFPFFDQEQFDLLMEWIKEGNTLLTHEYMGQRTLDTGEVQEYYYLSPDRELQMCRTTAPGQTEILWNFGKVD